MTFGKDFNAEQRAAFDAMSAERGSGMNSSLLNQDRSIGNSDGQYYYDAIRDEAIKPNNILNGYLGVQPIPNLMANGSSTRGSRGNRSSGMTMPTLQEQGIGDAQQYLRQDMMANGSSNRGVNTASNMMASGSNNGRGVDTSLSNTMGRDIAKGMGDGLNNVMEMTQGIQSKYGNPNDRSVQQIMSQYNADNAENAFQGMDNNRTLSQKIADRYDVTKDFRENEIDMKVMYNTDPNYKVHPSYGEAKGLNVLNAPLFGRTDLPSVLDGMVGGVQTAAMFGGDLLYQGIQAATDKNKSFGNVIPSAYEQARAYALGRFDPSIDVSNAQSLFDSATKLEPDNTDALRIAKQKEAGTFQPGKKAQAYEPVAPVAVVKPRVKVDYNKNTPAPTQKKQSRAGAGAAKAKVSRSTGSRGGRGNVAAKRSTPSKSYSSYSRRVGGR